MTPAIAIENQVVAVVQSEDRPVEIIVEGVRVIERLGGGIYFDYVQSTPATVWNINHNRGIYLNPEAYSVSGARVNGDILQISVNQVQIIFNQPVAGFAHLS